MPAQLMVQPGQLCQPDERKGAHPPKHTVIAPEDDNDLQNVYQWLLDQPIVELLRTATDDAVRYVLDGARTWRFNLMDDKVDSDERSSVGTKLQYHVIERLGLKKMPPLDTEIVGVAVEIKGTVRNGFQWMIPREGQCEVTLLIRFDPIEHQFAAWLMRAHRVWLTGGTGNQDKKRSTLVAPFRAFALPVVDWTGLPPEPLTLLSPPQLDLVFGDLGLRKRAVALFRSLPETVIPRSSLATVGAGLHDFMKRFREAKSDLRVGHGLVVLVGKWADERATAKALGHEIGAEDWVAIPESRFHANGLTVPPLRS